MALKVLQQYLPFTVLKPTSTAIVLLSWIFCCNSTYRLRYWNYRLSGFIPNQLSSCNSTYRLRYWNGIKKYIPYIKKQRLQQYLPFTVLKLIMDSINAQHPITSCNSTYRLRYWNAFKRLALALKDAQVATVLTVYGIETFLVSTVIGFSFFSCNSTYRLRYWNLKVLSHETYSWLVATVLTVYGIETA